MLGFVLVIPQEQIVELINEVSDTMSIVFVGVFGVYCHLATTRYDGN